jgi:hypothetical protein
MPQSDLVPSPLFLYQDYSVNPDDLEQGLFKSKILVQVSVLVLYCDFPSLSLARLSKLHSHLHLLQEKLMVMATELTS